MYFKYANNDEANKAKLKGQIKENNNAISIKGETKSPPNFLYGELNKRVEKVTYKGKDSDTISIKIDNSKRTIEAEVIKIPPSKIDTSNKVEDLPKGEYILGAKVKEDGKIDYKWKEDADSGLEERVSTLENNQTIINNKITNINNELTLMNIELEHKLDNVTLTYDIISADSKITIDKPTNTRNNKSNNTNKLTIKKDK